MINVILSIARPFATAVIYRHQVKKAACCDCAEFHDLPASDLNEFFGE